MRSASRIILFLSLICVHLSCSEEKKEDKVPAADMSAPTTVRRDPDNYFSDCRDLKVAALKMDSTLLVQTEVSDTVAMRGVRAFTDFAYYCHHDSMAPVYLVKTAQVARAINNLPQAENALKYCVAEFPDFRDRPAALFLLAQLYDEKSFMQNRDEAQRIYKQIIDEYPKSDWAVSAQGALAMLGKTDDEIIRMLKQRGK